MVYWAWTRCALFMHVVKYERKKPPFDFHCKFACAIIIDDINHYSKCIYIYTMLIKTNYPKYSVVWYSYPQFCLIKCTLFHIYLCRLYMCLIIRRHGVEKPSTLLALCEGNHLCPMDSPRNRPLWQNFWGVIMDKLLKTKQSGCRWFEGNDLRRHGAPWRHWNL